MNFTRTPRFSHTTLLALLAAGAATTAVACGAEEKKTASWNCASVDVPMGEVVRCTQSALTLDGPIVNQTGITDTTPVLVYECNAGEADCPPTDVTSTAPGGDVETCSGSTDNPDLCPPSTSTGGGSTDGTSGTGKGNRGNGTPDGSGKSSDSGGSSSTPGPDECAYVPAPYCSSSGDGTSQGGSSSGDSTCDHPSCDAPGQSKKGSSDAGSGSSGSGKGRHYKCTKDEQGNKSCEGAPECAPGTHPSACGACVADGDAADCVPPSAGGCWVTGGGFIIASNLTTGAAADGHDNFGGNAKPMKDGRVQGHWNHVDHGTGNHAKGKPEYIVCRHVDEPGPGQPGGKKGFTMNQVYFGGPAEWRSDGAWASGYWFDVVAKDHGEPGSHPHAKNGGMPDTYHFTIRKIDDPANQVSGPIVYETKGDLEGGNIQMHAPNAGHPYAPMALPSWVAFEP